MTWYIRPRQDFSLSRFSRICEVLAMMGHDYSIETMTGMRTGKNETVIRPARSISFCDMILADICKHADCNFKDFRIIEVNDE